MSELCAARAENGAQPVIARRRPSDIAQFLRIERPNYDYHHLGTKLRRQRRIPVLTTMRVRTTEQMAASSVIPAKNIPIALERISFPRSSSSKRRD